MLGETVDPTLEVQTKHQVKSSFEAKFPGSRIFGLELRKVKIHCGLDTS